VIILMPVFHYPNDRAHVTLTESGNIVAAIILSLLGGLLGPLSEEVLFRGLLHTGLRRHWTIAPSAILSSLLFSLMHFSVTPWMILDKFMFGMLCVYGLEKTKSIVPGLVLHCTNNLLLVSLMIFAMYF